MVSRVWNSSQPALAVAGGERSSVATAAGFLGAWLVVTGAFWALALVPAEGGAEWLKRTQYVCFGTRANGLPGPEGWLFLTLGPWPMLGAILVLFRDGLSALVRRPRAHRGLVVSLGFLLSVALVETSWAALRVRALLAGERASGEELDPRGPLPAGYPKGTRPAPGFLLTDQSGKQVGPGTFGGRVVLLTFAFAHCTTVCPTIVRDTAKALERVPDVPVERLIVTLDPWRDTPGSLPALAAKWDLGQGSHVLSGTVDAVQATLDAYNVPRSRDTSTGDVSHPSLVYVIDGAGRSAYAFTGPSVAWMGDAIRRAAAGGGE